MNRLMRTWALLAVVVAAVVGWGVPVAAARTRPAVRTYRPVFHQLPPVGRVLASGDYTLLVPVGQSTGTATLVDQRTGRSGTIAFGGPGCTAGTLTASAIVWYCGSPATPGEFVERLVDQSITRLPVAEPAPAAGGTDWLQYDFQYPGNEHNPTHREFLNLSSGQVVDDSSRIEGRSYPDLDSPSLYQKACWPVTLPGSFDGPARSSEPGSLFSFGSVAVGANADGGGLLRLQRCGSHHVLRIHTTSTPDGYAHNARIMVWSTYADLRRQQIDGIVPRAERRFTIAIPKGLAGQLDDTLELNNRTLYLNAVSGNVYRVTLPPELR